MSNQNGQKTRLQSVFDKFAQINEAGTIHVVLLGSITVDSITTNERTGPQIKDPELGGSAFRILDAWNKILKEENELNRFDLQMYGKRCYLSCESNERTSGWNSVFEELFKDSAYFEKLKTSLPAVKGKIPCSIHVLGPNGTREGHQRDEINNQISWDDSYLQKLFTTETPGVLYIGGIWRNQLHKGLSESLEKLSQKGWAISLHPGVFDSQKEPMLSSLRQALDSIDILFATPFTLLLMGSEDVFDLQLLKQQSTSALDFVVTGQLKLSKPPPIIVLHQQSLSLDMLISHPETLIRLPSPIPIGQPIHTPVGLRSAFIAAFLFHLCQQCKKTYEKEREPLVLLKDSLSKASSDAFKLFEKAFKEQNIRIFGGRPIEISPPPPHPIPGNMGMIGKSPAIHRVREEIANIVKPGVPESDILITGETGVGKELVAKAIHDNSNRKNKRFVPVNLSALAPGLIESELFGHEKGAFPGAIQRRIGRFEEANGGTIFLDEIGEISKEIQTKLLRVLQEREFERVGGNQNISVDVRVISATNKDLKSVMDKGEFREDLYHRLHVLPIHVPPLRERKEDIEILAKHFSVKNGCVIEEPWESNFGKKALEALKDYDWPGNVRELQHVISRLFINSRLPFTQEDVEKAIGEDEKKTISPAKIEYILEEIKKKFNIQFNSEQQQSCFKKFLTKYATQLDEKFTHKKLRENYKFTEYSIRKLKEAKILESTESSGSTSEIVFTNNMKQVLDSAGGD